MTKSHLEYLPNECRRPTKKKNKRKHTTITTKHLFWRDAIIEPHQQIEQLQHIHYYVLRVRVSSSVTIFDTIKYQFSTTNIENLTGWHW